MQKLQSAGRELLRRIKQLTEQVIDFEAKEIASLATEQGKKVLVRLFAGRDLTELRFLAKQITDSNDVAVVFGMNDAKAHVICAAPEKWSCNLNALVPQVASVIDGKGGGRSNFVEIGGHNRSALPQGLSLAGNMIENLIEQV